MIVSSLSIQLGFAAPVPANCCPSTTLILFTIPSISLAVKYNISILDCVSALFATVNGVKLCV